MESMLGISEMNMAYLVQQTGRSAEDIGEWLAKNQKDLSKITASNVDDIIGSIGRSDVIANVKNGNVVLETTKQKGNFGEMNMDTICENEKNLNRISKDRVTNLDDKIKAGIDGVYEDPTGGPPKYIIGESKYGSSQLNTLADGTKQMSDEWVKDRLIDAVGKEKANEILKELFIDPDNVQFTVFRTKDATGTMIEQVLDKNGKIVK